MFALIALSIISVIPWVIPGSRITLQNDEPNRQNVTVSINTKTTNIEIPGRATAFMAATEAGYVFIEAEKLAITAYATVDGATFAAVALNTSVRAVTVNPSTGLAIANPWSMSTRFSIWAYTATDGEFVEYKNFDIPAGKVWVGFFGDLTGIKPPSKGFQVTIASERPLAISAAECIERCVTIPVRAMGIREAGILEN